MNPPFTNLRALCKYFFKIDIYTYQLDILKAIFTDKKRKITIRSTTRAGKSCIIAIAAILYAVLNSNKSIGILAPTHDKARIIMDYIAEFLNTHILFNDIVMVSTEGLTYLERLRKEVSKRKITFTNGSYIEIKSVDLSRKGLAAMGFAYDFNIVEESSEIDDISYAKIHRMLVENPDAILLEIGNPWFLNHFYDHHHQEDWHKIHINWRDCVKEGRMTKEAIDEQRRELTDLEFEILFEAEFPKELEMSVFSHIAIKNSTRNKDFRLFEKYLMGIDVAAGGRDTTVITILGKSENEFSFIENKVMDTRDVMTIVGMAAEMSQPYKPIKIYIDTVGLGKGVHDRLKELGNDAYEFVAGKKARQKKRFFNIKTEVAFKMAEIMKEGKVWNLPDNSLYVLQLRSWTYKIRSDRQLKIIDPDRSPNEGDSLLCALSDDIFGEEGEVRGFTDIYKRRDIRDRLVRARDKAKRPVFNRKY